MKLRFLFFLLFLPLMAHGANPAFQDFRTNQFRTTGNKVEAVHGKTVIVDETFGHDSVGARQGVPFKTIGAANAVATAGDLVRVRPGNYTNTGILKNGVNYHGEWANVYAGDSSVTTPLIHDNGGAITSRVSGTFRFINPGQASVIQLTNPASRVMVDWCDQVWQSFGTDPVAAAIHQSGGVLQIRGRELRCEEYDGYWADYGVTLAPGGIRDTVIDFDTWIGADNIVETSLTGGGAGGMPTAAHAIEWGDIVIRGKSALVLTNRNGAHVLFLAEDRVIIDFDAVYADADSLAISSASTSQPQGPSVRLGTLYMTNAAAGKAAVRVTGSGALTLRDTTIISSNAIVPIHAGNSLLTLQNVRVHTGAAFAISNNSAVSVNVVGDFMANTNEHSNITFNSGVMARQSTGGRWVTPSTATGGSPAHGADGHVQFARGGTNFSDVNLTWDDGDDELVVVGTLAMTGSSGNIVLGPGSSTVISSNTSRFGGHMKVFGPLTNTTQVITGVVASTLWRLNTNQAMFTNGMFGIGKTPTVALDVNGNIGGADISASGSVTVGATVSAAVGIFSFANLATVQFNDQSIEVTADNQVLDLTSAAAAVVYLSSDSAGAGTRTFTITDPGLPNYLVYLIWTDTDAGDLADDSGTFPVRLSAAWTPTQNDVLVLMSTASAWIELGRSTN